MRPLCGNGRAWWTAALLLCAVLVVPLFLVDVPPLLDYPNHLARMVLLAWPHDPELSRFAMPHWAVIPNLGLDLVLPPLLHVLPVHVAGRLVTGLIVLLPVTGAAAYSRVAFGRWSWWALGAGLVAWNQTVLLGFLNFVAAIGLALWLAAGWIAWREARPRQTLLLAACGTVVLFFCHLMGLVFFAILAGAFELSRPWRAGQGTTSRRGPSPALSKLPPLPQGEGGDLVHRP